MNEVRVRVPATTANLGSGFDCLGVALGISNTTTVSRGRGGVPGKMASAAAAAFFSAAGVRPFVFHWGADGDVPRARGLGSSVTVRLGILHGLNALAGKPLDRRALFQVCAQLEGHPDNAAPAAFGGFTICAPGGTVRRHSVDIALQFVLLIPPFEVPTPLARLALPARIPFADAALGVANAAVVADAFASRDYRRLAGAFDDRIHQPYRAKLIPCLPRVIEAGCAAGALGGWLSGSGSAIACATLGGTARIAAAMHKASGFPDAVVHCVRADNRGARVLT